MMFFSIDHYKLYTELYKNFFEIRQSLRFKGEEYSIIYVILKLIHLLG